MWERAEALTSSPGRKKGTGTAQFRGDTAQRFTAALAVVLNARSSGNGGEERGENVEGTVLGRAALPTSYPSTRERREDREGERGALRFETERERGNQGWAVGEGEADRRARPVSR